MILSKCGAELFKEVLDTLPAEISLFCLLKSEANFGTWGGGNQNYTGE